MDPMHRFERVIRIIVFVIILAFVSLIIARVTQAQMSPYDDELSQQLRSVRSPVLSPDGRFMTYVRITMDAATHAVRSELVTVSVSDRKEVAIAPAAADAANRATSNIAYSPDSAVRFELSSTRDGATFTSVRLRDGVTSTLLQCACSLGQLTVDRAGTVAAFVRSSNTEPPDVWTIALTNGATTAPLTRVNARVVLEALMTEPETFAAPAAKVASVPMRVIPPASLESGHVYPTILRLVDTTHAASVYAFDDRAQLWSARGYGVLLLRVHTDMESVDAVRDVVIAVDAARARYRWIDSTRLMVYGATDHSALMTALLARPTQFKPFAPGR